MCGRLSYLASFVLVLLLAGNVGAFQVIDDFESGNLGAWEVPVGPDYVAVAPDPTDPGNQCLVIEAGEVRMRIPWGLPEGETETLYYRFMYETAPGGGTVNLHVGATDPVDTEWGNYYGLSRFGSNYDPANVPDMDVRDGGAYSALVYEDFQPLRWYQVVLEYNTATNTYDVYVDAELVFEAARFRSGYTPTNLEYILIRTTTWQGGFANGTVYVDDITVGAAPGFAKATGPNPQDGGTLNDTWVNLTWRPGDSAVSNDVYVGTDFDKVDEAAPDTFVGNTTNDFLLMGLPGYPFPDGLQAGATYYWRVDGINDADPDSPWKGDIWSFWVLSQAAYNPIPVDGMRFVETNVQPTWTPGENAAVHTVYFGTNADEIANVTTGGTILTTNVFDPGPLEPETTYYWRVDERAGLVETKGELWSFTTKREGGGLRGDYYNINPGTPDPPESAFSGSPVLTRIDPGINLEGSAGTSPEPNVVSADAFAVIWTGEIEIPLTGTYTFIPRVADGVILWINDEENARGWRGQPPESVPGLPLELKADDIVTMEMWYFQAPTFGGDWTVRLDWESNRFARHTIPAAACSPPLRASRPNPENGAVDVKQTPLLTWNAGQDAAQHDVYLGIDADAVAAADTSTASIYRGRQAQMSFAPAKLDWDTTYYWRIDEVNDLHPDSPWKGSVWSFTTGDFVVVDDFEDYTDDDAAGQAIWQHWIDGFGVADNGSQVGNFLPPYAEQTIVNSGNQSMPLTYDNTAGVTNSEAVLALTYPRDWTEGDVTDLSLWFRGYPASVGSFVEAPAGTFTMTASGANIWGTADECHYAFKTLTGPGSIVARVNSIENTNPWAKAGVMIRETLEAGSKNAFAFVTPENGVAFQRRPDTDIATTRTTEAGITVPHWVKVERDVTGNFTVTHSADGTSWQSVASAVPTNIPMTSNVYIGLALTSHDAAQTCQAVFSNVTTTGTVSGQWTHQDIGIASNAAEPMYVALSNSTGAPAVVANEDPAAAMIDTWTEWRIPLQAFADQGINLTDVDKIAIGLGSKGGAAAGGSGTMYIDDIRLYRPSETTGP